MEERNRKGVIMPRSILAGATAIAVAAFIPQLPATAQESAGIVVSAPAIRDAREPSNGVQQRKQFVAKVVVDTSDLDLRSAYGRAVLDARIELAADAACDRLDEIDPPVGPGGWNPDMGDCRHLAAKKAEPRMWAAIRADG